MSPWKSLIRDYIETRNQAELDGDSERMRRVLPDMAHLTQWLARMEQVRESRRQRGIQPDVNETRMRIIDVVGTDGALAADVLLRQSLRYIQYGKAYREERMERERIWLSQRNGRWRIERIVPEIPEKNPQVLGRMKIGRRREVLHASGFRRPDMKAPGRPYINSAVLAGGRSLLRQRAYQRRKVQAYADRWWDHPNPEFIHFQVDCTNYVSQCIFAGGAPMNYTGNRSTGWWYRDQGGKTDWSFSWSVANSLYWYLNNSRNGLTAQRVQSPLDLDIGDVILYDWDGNGEYQHSTIVTAFDGNGMPLVNAHTSNSRHRYWDYRDSYAWSEKTAYRFFHISDVF
jgi:hypothetical protein